MSAHYTPKTALGRAINGVEETLIALILGVMTIITFINVILRYVFQTGLSWGLEATSFLFAWLVLLGMSYMVKVTGHLGVDAVINILPRTARRVLGLAAAACCIFYAVLLMKGAWDYWANFANLPQTTGRWFPTGFEEMKRTSYRGWYEVLELPMPDWLRWIEPLMNEGEKYEKVPRFIPYFVLPFGMALLLFRFIEAGWMIATGRSESLIASHEAEEAVQEVANMNRGA